MTFGLALALFPGDRSSMRLCLFWSGRSLMLLRAQLVVVRIDAVLDALSLIMLGIPQAIGAGAGCGAGDEAGDGAGIGSGEDFEGAVTWTIVTEVISVRTVLTMTSIMSRSGLDSAPGRVSSILGDGPVMESLQARIRVLGLG